MRPIRWRVVVACLLLGAAANLVMAWWMAVAAQRATGFPLMSDREDRYGRWMVVWENEGRYFQTNLHRSRGWLSISESVYYPGIYITTRLDETELRERLPRWSALNREHLIVNYPPGLNGIHSLNEVASGWPFLCVRGRYSRHWEWDESLQRARITLVDAVGMIRVPRWIQGELDEDEYLPSLPIVAGFAANSAFYAALFALPFMMRRSGLALRRELRRRRNACPECAYPIGASPLCTECGAALSDSPTGAGCSQLGNLPEKAPFAAAVGSRRRYDGASVMTTDPAVVGRSRHLDASLP